MSELCKHWRLRIFPITNLHIAAGEWLDPTQYVITGDRLYILNQPRLISLLHARGPEKLKKISELSHDRIAKHLGEAFDPSQVETWTQRHPVDHQFQEEYLRNLDNPQAQQLVSAFISNRLTGNPYIPGSSIKGALRTALVAWRAKDPAVRIRRLDNGFISDRDLEPVLFNYLNDRGKPSIMDDPFKWLKVADCEFGMDKLTLRGVEIRKKNPRLEEQRAHPGNSLSYQAQVLSMKTQGISTTLSADQRWLRRYSMDLLISSCNEYFRVKLGKDECFYLPERKTILDTLTQILADLKPNQFLLRIGKGTGALHKSVNDPQFQTRSFAGGIPLGVCICTLEEQS